MAGKKNKIELQEFFMRLTDKIVSNYDVDEVLLFGSYAKGLETDISDIDVAVISPDIDPNKLTYQNVLEIKRKADILEPYLQLFAFNSNNFYKDKYIDPGFFQEIKKTSKQIYSRQQGLQLGNL